MGAARKIENMVHAATTAHQDVQPKPTVMHVQRLNDSRLKKQSEKLKLLKSAIQRSKRGEPPNQDAPSPAKGKTYMHMLDKNGEVMIMPQEKNTNTDVKEIEERHQK